MTDQSELKACKYTASHIANYFLSQPDHEIDNLKLNKLVFLAYGWGLALLGKRLFEEPIQAWKFGPVIPSVYHDFKRCGPDVIEGYSQVHDIGVAKKRTPLVPGSDREVMQLLDRTWEVYGQWSPIELVRLTHAKGSPWQTTYHENDLCLIIKNDIIQKYYDKEVENNKKRAGSS